MTYDARTLLGASTHDRCPVVPLVQLEIDARRIPCWYEYGAAELRELGKPTTVEFINTLREFLPWD